MNGNGRQYIRLAVGQPIEVQLQNAEGVVTQSPNGSAQVEFQLADGRVLCATQFQANKIKQSSAGAGDKILLSMANENGKSITTVTRIAPNASPPRPQPIPIKGEHQRIMTELGEVLTGANGNGHAKPNATASLMTGQSQFILQQMIAAVDVVRAVENYASSMGRPIEFSSEDIRALGISCFISQDRGAGR